MPQEVMAPKVLPTVATTTKRKRECFDSETRYANTASEPPGKSVDEIKALKKRNQRDIV